MYTITYMYVPMQARNPGGPSTSATVTIEVLDVNDVTPQFTQEIYNAAIVENRPAGASVVMVTATDDDEGANGMVRYRVIGGDVGVFQLDCTSGSEYMFTKFLYVSQPFLFLTTFPLSPFLPSTPHISYIWHDHHPEYARL